MKYPYGFPVVGTNLVGRVYRGAYLEEAYSDDRGTWHLVVIPNSGNINHANKHLMDVRPDMDRITEMASALQIPFDELVKSRVKDFLTPLEPKPDERPWQRVNFPCESCAGDIVVQTDAPEPSFYDGDDAKCGSGCDWEGIMWADEGGCGTMDGNIMELDDNGMLPKEEDNG